MTSKAVYYPVAGEGRGVATSSEAWWIRAVSRWKQERAERIVRTKTAYASHESLIDSAPWLKFPLVRKYGIEGGEGETLEQRNRGERHSMNFHRGLLSPSPPPLAGLAADFFIDNRDSVTSLRESYGSRSSPSPFSPPPRFTLGTSRRTKTIVDHGPASWVAINRGPDLDFQAGRRPVFAAFDSSLGREHFHYFRSGGNCNDKTLFPLHFPTGMDGWIDLLARWHALLHYNFELSNWVYHRSDFRRWQLWEEVF